MQPSNQLTESDWLHLGLARLDDIAEFPAGWDSNGADPPRPEIVAAARQVANLLCNTHALPRPWINATPSGTVQFEWEVGEKYFELEIMEPDKAEYYYADHDARVGEEGSLRDIDKLDRVAQYVFRLTYSV